MKPMTTTDETAREIARALRSISTLYVRVTVEPEMIDADRVIVPRQCYVALIECGKQAADLIESLTAENTRLKDELNEEQNKAFDIGYRAALRDSRDYPAWDEAKTFQALKAENTRLTDELAASQRRERAAVRRLQYEWDDILPVEYTGTTHHLKTVQPYYAACEIGEKTFELRKDDRNYAVGDILHLYEWDKNRETGRSHYKQVTYILRDAPYVPDGYACLAILPITPAAAKDAKIEWRGPEAWKGE